VISPYTGRACLCKRSDGLRVRRVGTIVRRQSTTEILFSLNNRFHSGQQLFSRIRFNDVAQCTQGESFLYQIGRRFLAHEEYFAFGREFADSSSGFDSVHRGKTDVEQNQVRLQFVRSLKRL